MEFNPIALIAGGLALFLLTRKAGATAAPSDWREVPMPIPPPSDEPTERSSSGGRSGAGSGGRSSTEPTSGPSRAAVRRFQLALQAYQDDRRERTPSLSPEADGVIGAITRGAWMQFLQDVRALELLAATAGADWPVSRNGRLLYPPGNRSQSTAASLLGSGASARTLLLRRNPSLTLPSDASLTGAAEFIEGLRGRLNRASDPAWPRYVSQLGAAL